MIKTLFFKLIQICFVMSTLRALANPIDISKYGGPSHGKPEIHWYNSQLDYINSTDTSSTFKLRYILDKQYYKPDDTKPNIALFYCGNEANVFTFYNTSGY